MEAAAAAAQAKEEHEAAAALFRARGGAAKAARRRSDSLKGAMSALLISPAWGSDRIVQEVLFLAWGASKDKVWQLTEEERAMLQEHIVKYRASVEGNAATKPKKAGAFAGEDEPPSLLPVKQGDDQPPTTIGALYAETADPSPAQAPPPLGPERHAQIAETQTAETVAEPKYDYGDEEESSPSTKERLLSPSPKDILPVAGEGIVKSKTKGGDVRSRRKARDGWKNDYKGHWTRSTGATRATYTKGPGQLKPRVPPTPPRDPARDPGVSVPYAGAKITSV